MPYTSYWDNDEKTIFIQKYSGAVSIEDYYHGVDDVWHTFSTLSHTIHVIQIRENVTTRQRNMINIARYANSHTPKNLGIRVVVGADGYFKTLITLIKRFAPQMLDNVYFADNLTTARDIIATYNDAKPAH